MFFESVKNFKTSTLWIAYSWLYWNFQILNMEETTKISGIKICKCEDTETQNILEMNRNSFHCQFYLWAILKGIDTCLFRSKFKFVAKEE